MCVSNVSSSCYDLAAYAALFSVILEQSAAIGRAAGRGSGGGVRSKDRKSSGQNLKSDRIALKTSYFTAGEQKKRESKIWRESESVHESKVLTQTRV